MVEWTIEVLKREVRDSRNGGKRGNMERRCCREFKKRDAREEIESP